MVSIWRSLTIRTVVIALLLIPAVGIAADFELFWDPNCNVDDDLEGYYIYYREEESVILNLADATEIYVPLSENGFDPNAPNYIVSGLIDDIIYCFTVSAWYGNDESRMSNEICGINGRDTPGPDGGGASDRSTGSGGGGCFIDVPR